MYDRAGWSAASILGACYAAAALLVWTIDQVLRNHKPHKSETEVDVVRASPELFNASARCSPCRE